MSKKSVSLAMAHAMAMVGGYASPIKTRAVPKKMTKGDFVKMEQAKLKRERKLERNRRVNHAN